MTDSTTIELPGLLIDGEFVEPPDAENLPPPVRQVLDACRAAWLHLKDCERACHDAEASVTAALAQLAEAEEACRPYGRYDFHRLWKDTFGR